jgi:acyl-CoA synthetase (AMP-forming)/AMP-acid ligase II
MNIDFLLERFAANREHDAIIWRDQYWKYGWLLDRVREWQARIQAEAIAPGSVVLLDADFSPNSVALWLALVEYGCIIVPLTSSVAAKKAEFTQISQGEVSIELNAADVVTIRRTGLRADHELYGKLREPGHPGLVLFSSGSTGKSKGAVHDLLPMLEKFKVPRPALRSISFLLFDHIGGVNTMLYILANNGCMVTVQERTPDAVLNAIQNHKVELLPTSPTFINLIILSEAWKRFDLSTLRTVTYGTEPMLESTLKRFHELFPHIKLQQTYGLSEVGILRSQSRSSDSLWVRLGGEGFETRIVDGVFQIKAKSAMLGYLNAPSPFTEDGWFNTGDMVEVDGDYVRFLGRKSEIINVGGEKVYPAEVENVLQSLNNVAEVTVFGEKHPLTGHIVVARFRLLEPENPAAFRNRVRTFCQGKIERHKIPARILIVENAQHSSRFKKMRLAG